MKVFFNSGLIIHDFKVDERYRWLWKDLLLHERIVGDIALEIYSFYAMRAT